MALNRIGSVTVLNNTLQDVAQSQAKLATLQTQISSGLKAKNFEGLDGSVEIYTTLTNKQRVDSQFKSGNTVAIGQLQTADNALGTLVDISDKISSLITSSINSATAPSLNFEQQMRDLLQQLGGQLNTTYNGHYIFGGTNTTQQPVPDTSLANVTPGIPDDIYYAGSKQDVVLRANDQISYAFPVRADNKAFQKIYAAAQQAISAFKSSDYTTLKSSLDLAQQGGRDLVDARTKLNTILVNTTAINTQIDAQNTYLKGLTDEVSNTDIVAASTQVSNYEAILQATYQVYARLSQLRLSDYLK